MTGARGGRAARLALESRLRTLAGHVLHGLRLPLRWVSRQEAVVLVTAFGIVLTLYGFLEVTEEIFDGDPWHFDEWLLRRLRRHDDLAVPIGPPWLAALVIEITALGGVAVLCVALLFAVGYLVLEHRRDAAVLVIVASAGGGLLSVGLKQVFARHRPTIVPHLITVDSLSFPSGHSMAAAVIYLTLGALLARFAVRRRTRIYVIGLSFALTFLIGASRVFLGVHYPSDVLAGWSAGLAWALLCWLVARYLQYRGTLEPPGAHVPR